MASLMRIRVHGGCRGQVKPSRTRFCVISLKVTRLYSLMPSTC